MPHNLTRDQPNDHPEANRYSTDAAYCDANREVKSVSAEAIMQIAITKTWSTETLQNPSSQDETAWYW